MTNKAYQILEFIAKNEIKFLDFRFTTSSGRFLRIAYHVDNVDQNTFLNGIPFDSSSIDGWKPIENSDMVLIPDVSTAFLDPFTAQPTLCILCDVRDVESGADYNRDPRSTAKRAQEFLKKTKVADTAYFGLEMEFFIFDDVRFAVTENGAFFELDSGEGTYNSGRKYEYNNHGHRYPKKDCYLASGPNDALNDIRAEILETLKEIKVRPTLHHHEVASSQCEVGFYHGSPIEVSDNAQKCKYVVRGVASSYGKSATFMPKPFKDDNGSGMHIHQSLWKDGNNLFAPDKNGEQISELCIYYIGGIIKHARAINAFANPTTNSYKRLVPGYEAPIKLAYSFYNRSAAIRIPYASTFSASSRRIEVRFPDACANPYLVTSAMLMAGIDGIKNKIHPGDPVNQNLFKSESKELNSVCKSLEDALHSLDEDREFLKEGGVFSDDQIDSYIKLKQKDLQDLLVHPHPIEFVKYYSS